LEAHPVSRIKKVVSLDKLRKEYSQFKQKRELCESFDLFLSDDRILPMLPKVLGKVFFEKKKQPIPVVVTSKNLNTVVDNACNHTYLFLSGGVCSAVRVATTEFEEKHIVDNILSAVKGIAEVIPGKWKNIQSINIKTADSVALPIYNSYSIEEDPEEEAEEEAKKEAKKEAKAAAVAEKGGKGKKRALEADGAETVATKKKKVEEVAPKKEEAKAQLAQAFSKLGASKASAKKEVPAVIPVTVKKSEVKKDDSKKESKAKVAEEVSAAPAPAKSVEKAAKGAKEIKVTKDAKSTPAKSATPAKPAAGSGKKTVSKK
jgi:ribosome biogenesis protein UTP30